MPEFGVFTQSEALLGPNLRPALARCIPCPRPIGTTVPTHDSDDACHGSDTAERPGVKPNVLLKLRVPCIVVRRGVPMHPRLVGHGGTPRQERHGIRADGIPQLPAVMLD